MNNFKKTYDHFIFWIKAFFLLSFTKGFWKFFFKLLFVGFFWQGLGATIVFLFLIPAMKSGDISIWLALIISVSLGFFSVFWSGISYRHFVNLNPFKKLIRNRKK